MSLLKDAERLRAMAAEALAEADRLEKGATPARHRVHLSQLRNNSSRFSRIKKMKSGRRGEHAKETRRPPSTPHSITFVRSGEQRRRHERLE
jgi:hypothetical protein